MSRPNKKGFDYFSLDCTFFDDIKTRKLVRRCGADAVAVYVAILCLIFKEGYYLVADEDLAFIISEKTGLSEEICGKCILACVETGMFDKDLYKQGIITSHGIQKRYQSICIQSKRVSRIDEYSLLVSSEDSKRNGSSERISSEETTSETGNQDNSSGFMPQRKEKKSKVKKSNSSFDSSLWSEDKEKILFNFFFRNLASPEKEVENFLRYNNEGNRSWDALSDEKKAEAITRWQQQPAKRPRFDVGFLSMWKKVYMTLSEMNAPGDVLQGLLSDKVSVKLSGGIVRITFGALEPIRYIEEVALDKVRDDMMAYAKSQACSNFRYNVDTTRD